MKSIRSLPEWQRSEPRIARRPANPRDDPRVEVWSDPQAVGNPQAAVDERGDHYELTGGQISLGKQVSETWFAADEVDSSLPERRQRLYRRIWRIDRGLDIDPADRSLGAEVGHYADSTVDTEVISNYDRFRHNLADTCLQQLELPRYVRNRALHLIDTRSLKGFSRYEGLNGAIVGFTVQALVEYRDLREVADLKETPWWPRIRALADHLGVVGATGRKFGQLIEYVEKRYEGGNESR